VTKTAAAVALHLAQGDHGRPSRRGTRPGSPWGFRLVGQCPGRWWRRGKRLERLLRWRPTQEGPALGRRGFRHRRWWRRPGDRFNVRSARGAQLQNALGPGVPVGFSDGDRDRSEAIADLLRERHEFVEGGTRAVGQLGLGLYRGVEPLQEEVPEQLGVLHPHEPAAWPHQPLVESALTFVLALLRGTEGHFDGVQGVLGRIASQQVVNRVREAGTDGTAVWSIRLLDEVVLGLTANAVG